MRLGQRADQRQSQHMVMTPQLQAAIKLLQLNNMELQDFVHLELEKNPFLETEGEFVKTTSSEDKPLDSFLEKLDFRMQENSFKEASEMGRQYETLHDEDFGSDKNNFAQTDNHHWNNVKQTTSKNFDDDLDSFAAIAQDVSLQHHLLQQLHIATQNQVDLFIGHLLINSVTDAGYFLDEVGEIARQLGLPVKRVEKVLKLCQGFEPAGIFARNLKECLTLQAKDQGLLSKSFTKLLNNLDLVARGDLKTLMLKTQMGKEEALKAIENLKALNPKPGLEFVSEPLQPIIPDVLIEETVDGGWRVEMNGDTLPKVMVNQSYYTYVNKNTTAEDKEFVQENYQNAAWLIKSIEQRTKTILKVATEIVKQQDGFFAYGISELRPMNLKLVAEAIGMHESTISRVTSNKYLRCPRGVFELKFFFMSGISNDEGEASVASQTVKHHIKSFVMDEDTKILSDDDIVAMLSEKGIKIARRTVTKYREAMNIPSSIERRRVKKAQF